MRQDNSTHIEFELWNNSGIRIFILGINNSLLIYFFMDRELVRRNFSASYVFRINYPLKFFKLCNGWDKLYIKHVSIKQSRIKLV